MVKMKNRSCSDAARDDQRCSQGEPPAPRQRLPRTPARGGRRLRPSARARPRSPSQSTARGNRPRGRMSSTSRNATWPASICHSGLIAAPAVWATPMTMPPASVPQKRAEAADDHSLECIDQPGGADGRVEIGADAEVEGRDCRHHHGDPGGQRDDAPGPDAHQAGGDAVVGGRAEGAAERGAIEQRVEADDDGDRRDEGQKRHQRRYSAARGRATWSPARRHRDAGCRPKRSPAARSG